MVVVRQIDIFGVAAKSKLQDAHAGKAKIVPQPLNVGRNHAQIFSDDWNFAQRLANRGEQFPARRFNPTTALGRFVAARDLPAGSKPAKVIDARDVNGLQGCTHAFNPPPETIAKHSFPIVKRVTPELSGSA